MKKWKRGYGMRSRRATLKSGIFDQTWWPDEFKTEAGKFLSECPLDELGPRIKALVDTGVLLVVGGRDGQKWAMPQTVEMIPAMLVQWNFRPDDVEMARAFLGAMEDPLWLSSQNGAIYITPPPRKGAEVPGASGTGEGALGTGKEFETLEDGLWHMAEGWRTIKKGTRGRVATAGDMEGMPHSEMREYTKAMGRRMKEVGGKAPVLVVLADSIRIVNWSDIRIIEEKSR